MGDWVIGTGSSGRDRKGQLVYAMRISETMTFDDYWWDERFKRKQPNMKGSSKQAFGDNIYHRDENGRWQQQDSHHSYENGLLNHHNIDHDTSADRVLIGADYMYWGGFGPMIPLKFRDYDGFDICAGHGHKSRFPDSLVADFEAWLRSLRVEGYLGRPLDWPGMP